jgi:hypothetical protein
MKAITLHFHIAHLVAIGAKRWETRSWRTNHRGLLAIHAGANTDVIDSVVERFDEKKLKFTFKSPWDRHLPRGVHDVYGGLASGGVAAIVLLKDCVPAHQIKGALEYISLKGTKREKKYAEEELAFGDFSTGRWAWEMECIANGGTGHLIRGYQGLWDLPPKEETLLISRCVLAGIDLVEEEKKLQATAVHQVESKPKRRKAV